MLTKKTVISMTLQSVRIIIESGTITKVQFNL